jgi:hypothetical protein
VRGQQWLRRRQSKTIALRCSIGETPVEKVLPPRSSGLLWAGLLLLALSGCSRSTPEERLRATIGEMQAAAESREPRAFIEFVSEDFIGTPGDLDRDGLRNVLRGLLLGQQRVGVSLGPLEVKLYGSDRARVETRALVTGSGGMLDGDTLAIRSDWRIEDGEWRCIAATWE